jgi:ADP-heptose:LPS heptosyltransferase
LKETPFKKILIIRFSSIGDIVLTTTVIRNLRQAYPEAEIHFLTKAHFTSLLVPNPYLDQIHGFSGDLKEKIQELKKIGFDLIVDLHKNLRSLRVRLALGGKQISFGKKNWEKFWLVRNKKISGEIGHIVDRYEASLTRLGIESDGQGLDFFLPESATQTAQKILQENGFADKKNVLAVVLGATYSTKRWPVDHFTAALSELNRPVILLGGKDAREEADRILSQVTIPVLDAVGNYNISTAAALMKSCQAVLTHDTGFMHIAAAFKMKVFSLWGSTVPEFGMTPFKTEHFILENKAVNCRPCSKLGHHQCPKAHFNCMNQLRPDEVIDIIRANTP